MTKFTFLAVLAIAGLFFCSCESDYDDGSYNFASYDNYGGEGNEKYNDYGENPFIKVAEQPVSTFAVDADGGSYANMRRFLYIGQAPPVASVRIEEYINYFTFDYDEPAGSDNVALNSEIATCPWNTEHYILRLGMKGKTIPESELPNSNYVFLIDVSGSMNYPEKLGILKTGFKAMVDNLEPKDRIAIVVYAGHAGVLLQSTSVDEKEKIKYAIDQLGAGGSTAGAAGINTAYEIAEQNFIHGGNNRIILGTDGDFNVGISSQDALVELIEEKRDMGIYLTVLGVGTGNLNDAMMEQVANHGNGNYEYIDNAAQMQKVFVKERAKFYTVAKDAKIQVTFDSVMVNSYRLVGYENRALNNDDFEKDTVDAGEIGATQTITAIYELVVNKEQSGVHYANFDFRYKKPNENESRLLQEKVESLPVQIENASDNMRFAASVVAFGLLMKQSEYKGTVSKQMVLNLGGNATGFDNNGYKNEFLELVRDWTD